MAYSRNYYMMPPIVKNLLIINGLVFLAELLLPRGASNWMMENLTLHFWKGGQFEVYQLVTYMFLHANFTHLFFNMFALWMFGRVLEADLGSRRFFVYYMLCGVGAGLIQLGVNWIDYAAVAGSAYTDPVTLYRAANAATLGASGAIFGVLLAFGLMHPNNVIMLLFPPIPLKAKWFVLIYGLLELGLGIAGSGGGIAHFAHVGGMLWGWGLLWYWKRKHIIYY